MKEHNSGLRCFCCLDWSSRFDPTLLAAVLAIWIGILPRLVVPDRHLTDRGVYVSVAERLLAGDILYSGVYDNKEPLFYFFVAIQRVLGSWAEPAAEAMLIAIAATATYFIALKVSTQWTAVAISFIAVPIIVTGSNYYPGISLWKTTLERIVHRITGVHEIRFFPGRRGRRRLLSAGARPSFFRGSRYCTRFAYLRVSHHWLASHPYRVVAIAGSYQIEHRLFAGNSDRL
jgi:hypothetical protein